MGTKALRVAQWGTGVVGVAAVRKVLDHPELELVACFAHGADKVGRDVGSIVGTGETGIRATDRIETIVAARPDCVLYMPLVCDVDALATLLEAGINVVSTAGFITGRRRGPEATAKVESAAIRGGASLYGTGINPGLANLLGLVATSVCGTIEKVSVLESVDATHYASPETWHSLGFGGPPDAEGLADAVRDRGTFVDGLEMMAEGLGVAIERIEFRHETAVATQDLSLGYMDIAKGTVCGLKMVFSAIVDGISRIELGTMWRIGDAMMPDWRPEGYIAEVTGTPDVRLVFSTENDPTHGGYATAMAAVHAIASVCAARPGIVRAYELPPAMARHAVAAARP